MSTVAEPKAVPTNRRGLSVKDYGGESPRCASDVVTT